MNNIVHILQNGLALCQFSREVPGNWPNGHKWACIDDVENVTCLSCKEQAELLETDKKIVSSSNN